ncbi:ComEC/Rec2 family competence protein [Winogradskyella sp. PE311]|uniref:ComEC/Rec2 family competence protein n=1 Tax=Winogradskyella sp. PE311 TaxID=3366943 RepID=UPI00397FFE68
MILGIILAHYIQFSFQSLLYIIIGLILLLSIYWLILRGKVNDSPFFGILAYLCMVGVGMMTYAIENEKLQKDHYSHLNISENYNNVTFRIKERLKTDSYNDKYIVAINTINGKKASGKLLININHNSVNNSLSVDDLIYTSSKFEVIQKPLNPHQFDYSKYLKLRQVYHQTYLESDELLLISNSKTTIYGYADALRTQINLRLMDAGFKDKELSIINALLLGQRQTIDKTIYNNYVNSGTIHILAVSGLHVGVLLWILNFLFRPLLYLKYGNYIRPLVLIIILWSFAIIAGLSPSVTRAVTMFSVISIAMHLKRPANIYNTLVISAFIILLFKPTFLFEVGFQMSYLAVLGIVSVQPIIYKLWKPKFLVSDKLWQIFTVTLAAQAGVVPISLFYFHQFPGLFFISNIVVIPFLGLILGFGLLVIVLALLNILPEFVVTTYSYIIESLNNFIAWVAQFEDFLFRDIPFTILQVLISYFIIIALVKIYKTKAFKWVSFCLFGIIAFQSIMIYNSFASNKDDFIIFNKSRFSIIGERQNDQLLVHHNLDSLKQQTDNVIRNYKVGELIDSVSTDSLQSIYRFKNKTILVIDSLAIYKNISFKPNYILLRNSPKLNLNRVIDSLQPEKIIIDASNYKSYVTRWKTTCRNKKIPFHYTYEKGAFFLN